MAIIVGVDRSSFGDRCVFAWDYRERLLDLVSGIPGAATNITFGAGAGVQGIRFNGGTEGNSRIAFAHVPACMLLPANNKFSIYAEVHLNGTTNGQKHGSAYVNRSDPTLNANCHFGLESSNLAFGLHRSTSRLLRRATSTPAGRASVVCTYDGSGTHTGCRIYRNGIRVDGSGTSGTGDFPTTGEESTSILVGEMTYTTSYGCSTGTISSYRLYDRVLTENEAKALAINPDLGLVMREIEYSFAGTGPVVVDGIGLSIVGTDALGFQQESTIVDGIGLSPSGADGLAIGSADVSAAGTSIVDTAALGDVSIYQVGSFEYQLVSDPHLGYTLRGGRISSLCCKDPITGDLVAIVQNAAQSLTYMFTSQDGGYSWQGPVGSSVARGNRMHAACFDSTGRLNLLHLYAGANSFSSATFTRSSGHIVEWSWTSPFYLPAVPNTLGTNTPGHITTVLDGNGVERLFYSGTDGDYSGTPGLDLGYYRSCVCHSQLNPTSASQLLALDGTAGSWTTLALHQQQSSTELNQSAGYWWCAQTLPYGTAGNLFSTNGPMGRGDCTDYGTGVYGQRLLASGSTWSVDATVETLTPDSFESLHGNGMTLRGAAYWPVSYKVDDVTNGDLRVSKIAADGTFTASIAPYLEFGDYGTEPCLHMLAIDDSRIAIVEIPISGGPLPMVRIHILSGGSWTSDRFSLPAYDDIGYNCGFGSLIDNLLVVLTAIDNLPGSAVRSDEVGIGVVRALAFIVEAVGISIVDTPGLAIGEKSEVVEGIGLSIVGTDGIGIGSADVSAAGISIVDTIAAGFELPPSSPGTSTGDRAFYSAQHVIIAGQGDVIAIPQWVVRIIAVPPATVSLCDATGTPVTTPLSGEWLRPARLPICTCDVAGTILLRY